MKSALKWAVYAGLAVLVLVVFVNAPLAGKLSMAAVGFGLWIYHARRPSGPRNRSDDSPGS